MLLTCDVRGASGRNYRASSPTFKTHITYYNLAWDSQLSLSVKSYRHTPLQLAHLCSATTTSESLIDLQFHDEDVFPLRLKAVYQFYDARVRGKLLQDVDLSHNAFFVNLSLLHHFDGVVDFVLLTCALKHFAVGSAEMELRRNCGKTLSHENSHTQTHIAFASAQLSTHRPSLSARSTSSLRSDTRRSSIVRFCGKCTRNLAPLGN